MRFYCLLLGLILWNKTGIKISPRNKKQIDYPNHIRNNLWTIWAPVNYKSLLREWWLWGDMSDIQGDSQWGHGVKACLLILQYNHALPRHTPFIHPLLHLFFFLSLWIPSHTFVFSQPMMRRTPRFLTHIGFIWSKGLKIPAYILRCIRIKKSSISLTKYKWFSKT